MLAKIGTGLPVALRSAVENCSYCFSSVMASGKIMSAPASTQAIARSIALSMPSTAKASVRAMITNSGLMRASTAALTRSTISCWLTIALFGR
ncbi:Uncharacterised protein [Vibrio cholerae]|nr:Uncharacterised protein [Vibrio cholerae]CSI60993.1 Uncharacterised protein [Vibrio cholerae]